MHIIIGDVACFRSLYLYLELFCWHVKNIFKKVADDDFHLFSPANELLATPLNLKHLVYPMNMQVSAYIH